VSAEAVLRATDIAKSYAGVRALEGVSLELRAGEVHAIVGENGAGKSTLIKILTGATTPDAGSIEVRGAPSSRLDPQTARAFGIAAIYQQPTLFPHLTVAENLALGLEQRRWFQAIDWNERRTRARALLARIKAHIDPDQPASELSMAAQQLVEIARALGTDARIVIMDEPTAALPQDDVERLLEVVRQLRRDGVAVVYISHRLDEVFALADRITVLRDGRLVATGEAAGVDRSELIRMMVGRDVQAVFSHERGAPGGAVLQLDRVGCEAAGIADVSLTVRGGEIFGLAGLVGAGRTELARVIFGVTPADRGTIAVDGRPIVVRRPADAAAERIAYVPEDRRRHGVIPQMRVASNIKPATLRRIAGRLGWLRIGDERQTAGRFVRELGVKPPSIDADVSALSGGNQQKVALARWLMTDPRVLILDEPTQGIDVGAKADVHREMGRLAREGVAILMISSDLPEVIAMSDRIGVMRGGRLAGVLEGDARTPERVMQLALGEEAA
jgi:rhamnose transport system ATP-binding protein